MKKDIKERIEAIYRGEIPEGYEKGREGLYPVDWSLKPIQLWLELCERPVKLEDNTEYELVTVRRNYGGVDSRGVYKGKEILVKNYFEVRAGDFLISKRQIAHGACGIVPQALDHAVVSNEYNIFTAREGKNIRMFALMMQLPRNKRVFYLMSDGVHIEKLLFKTSHWLKRNLAMPTNGEQLKIAKILYNYDIRISLEEKFKYEKEKQMEWMMQNLLTGRKQLKGFLNEWKSKKFGNLCNIRKGQQLNNNELRQEDKYYMLNGGSVPSGYTNEWNTNENTISISEGGNSCGYVNFNKEKFWSGGHCYTVDGIIKEIDVKFLYYQLKYNEKKIMDLRVGSGLPNIQKKSLESYKIKFPQIKEQKAIAQILSKADEENELLQQRLELMKLEKKAMMQLLLTGIVRVN